MSISFQLIRLGNTIQAPLVIGHSLNVWNIEYELTRLWPTTHHMKSTPTTKRRLCLNPGEAEASARFQTTGSPEIIMVLI